MQTTSYAVDLQLLGVRDFPAQMGASAAHSNFTEEARFGVEWLLRMWNDETRTLYYQVGIGEGNANTVGDHDIWRLPQEDDTYGGRIPRYRFIRHRPVFRAGPPGSPVSPNLAGRDAAAFAVCFQVFNQTRPALASRCLLAGEHIFELADTDPQGNLLTAIPFNFYPESEWRDDLELGATELAIALASGQSCRQACPTRSRPTTSKRRPTGPGEYIAHNPAWWRRAEPVRRERRWRTSSSCARCAPPADPPGLAVSEEQLIAASAKNSTAAVEQSQRDPFGFGFPWDEADTASHGDGLSVMASEYDYLTGEPTYRAARGALAGQRPRSERVGLVVHHRRRHHVSRLPPAPGGEHRRLARRLAAGPGGRGGGGAEQRTEPGQACGHAALPGGRRQRIRALRQRGGVRGQRAVLHDHRAGDRPHRVLDAGVLLADRFALAKPS